MFDKQEEMKRKIEEEGLRITPGISWITTPNGREEFSANGGNRPEIEILNQKIDKLRKEFLIWYKKKYGKDFEPDLSWVTNPIYKTDEEKADSLWRHSERYALVFGLDHIPKDKPIIIINNLRICGDCHPVIVLLSEMLEREIRIRDANRWHYFKNGKCSCNNYF